MDENKIPVIVGVGQINDRDERLNSVELMAAALRNADTDGGGGWLGRVDALDVVAIDLAIEKSLGASDLLIEGAMDRALQLIHAGPQRPKPHCTSSKMSTASVSSQRLRRALR